MSDHGKPTSMEERDRGHLACTDTEFDALLTELRQRRIAELRARGEPPYLARLVLRACHRFGEIATWVLPGAAIGLAVLAVVEFVVTIVFAESVHDFGAVLR